MTIPPGWLVENKTYEIEACVDGQALPAEMDVVLNDVPLDRVVRNRRTVFPFETEFYAGDLRLSVVRDGKPLASSEFEVDPHVAKLTRDEYAVMISDIAKSTLALYRLGAVTVPATTYAGGAQSDLVTLDLVRSNFASFERAVSRIADQPVRNLRSVAVPVDIMRARRVDDRAITAALRSNGSRLATALEAKAAPRIVGALRGRWIQKVDETRREERVDVYENRALLGFIRWLDARLTNIVMRLSDPGEYVRPTAAGIWHKRVEQWRVQLAALAKRDMFIGMQPEPKLHATSVFRLHPDYASAYAAMTRMKAGLGTGTSITPAVPIDRTYALYEQWCYIGILMAAAEAFPSCRSDVAILLQGCSTPNILGTVLAQGNPSTLHLEQGLTLTYQRRFSPKVGPDGSHTVVVEAVPDITLARTDAFGRCMGVVVIDPKYRSGGSLLDGIRDLHVYRDAIIGDSGRLVKGAVAVAPRPQGLPKDLPNLPAEFPVALTARPGHDVEAFQRILAAAVGALT